MKPIDFNARREVMAARLRERGLDAYLGTRHAALHYLGGVFMPWRGVAVVTSKGDFTLLYWGNDADRVKREGPPMEVVTFSGADMLDKLKEALASFGLTKGRLGVDLSQGIGAQPAPGILTAAEYLGLLEVFPDASIHNAADLLDDLLLIKDDAELERLRAVAQIADYGFQEALKAMRAGMTENQLAGIVEKATRDRGSYWAWSVTAGTEAGFGERSAFKGGVTQIATEKKLCENEFVILDFHPSYELYLCDFSVPIFFGSPDKEQQSLIACWEEAVETVFNAVRPGGMIGEAVQKGIAVYEKHGLSEYSLPRFGHGLGLCVRTGPLLNAKNSDIFRPGMTFAMGAHLYRPGVGGLRLEYPVMVNESGAKQLSDTPMKVHIVPAK